MRHIGLMAGVIASSAFAAMEQQVITASISDNPSSTNKPYKPRATISPEPEIETRQVRRARERKTGRYK